MKSCIWMLLSFCAYLVISGFFLLIKKKDILSSISNAKPAELSKLILLFPKHQYIS